MQDDFQNNSYIADKANFSQDYNEPLVSKSMPSSRRIANIRAERPVKLAIVSPCYNEEEVIEESVAILSGLLDELAAKGKVTRDSFVMLVNDGSADNTWELICALHETNPKVKGVCLSYNSGHQHAIMAGMMSVKNKVNAAVTIDVDLQDDIEKIEEMIDEYRAGADVVYGVKRQRKADSGFKRLTASMFYGFQSKMGVKAIKNHADFRLVSNKVLVALSGYSEQNLFLRGLIPKLGFKYSIVEEDISERRAGESKYTMSKMLRLATDGITSYSSKPLRIIFWIGIIFLVFALINAIDIIVSLFHGTAAPGWSQLMLSVWCVGGLLMIALSIVGVYIGRIYTEVKRRPQYLISEVLD